MSLLAIVIPPVNLFSTSSWQYEMQFKRWNIRKNATRKEWQQYFSKDQHRSMATSIDASGTSVPPIILSKSTASKKRASRWVAGSLVEPGASQASGSTLPGNAARPIAASISDEQIALEAGMRPDIQDLFMNVAEALDGSGNIPEYTDSSFNIMVIDEPHAGSSQAFFDAAGEPAQPLDLNPTSVHALSSQMAPASSSSVLGQDYFVGFLLASLGIPSENNMTFFSILNGTDFKRELPSGQLEHNLRSKGIVLDKRTGRKILGGFAPKFVASILSSKYQSTGRQTPNLQHFLRMLGSQVPGESSALITDDQAFETKFARVLLFSLLNGLAGLEDVPMENILRFLNRFVVNKLILDILEQCPQHVSRTLADNIFRAAIEATDTDIVKLLLDRKLVDVNETVCFHVWGRWTPIQRASELGSLRLMQALIDRGADVNKRYVKSFFAEQFTTEGDGGALDSLKAGIRAHLMVKSRSTIPPESIEAFNILVVAGARVHPRIMIFDRHGRTVEFDFLVSQNVPCESHRGFFGHEGHEQPEPRNSLLNIVAEMFDDRSATILVRTVMRLCHEASCNKCFDDFGHHLRTTVALAAETGKIELVQLLLDKADLDSELPRILLSAIKSQNHTLIDFILSKELDLDPPATSIGPRYQSGTNSTPIAEAVRYGNEDLIRRLEAGGSLDQLSEGGRFECLVEAAAEVGNTAYTRKLLTRAITSKQAYRCTGEALRGAICGGHQDIAQMLLEAGVLPGPGPYSNLTLFKALEQSNVLMVRDIIAAGMASTIEESGILKKGDYSIILDCLHEFPGLRVDGDFLQDVLSVCIELDTLDFFKEILQTLEFQDTVLNKCLSSAVKFGHADMVEYLLDMGANPFNDQVLKAVIPDRPDILQLLFQKERLRQTMPKCIGARILVPVMGKGAGNAEALDELIRTEAINFTRLEILYEHPAFAGFREEYTWIRFTPLGLAIQGVDGGFDTNMVAVKKFLDSGADPNGISKSNHHWTKGSPLMTALMVAIETGCEDAVNMLLDYSADVNARPRIRTTRTALQYAAELGNMDLVRLLLSRGADVNSSASSRGGATALQFAAMSGNCNMVAHLLDHGAQLDAPPSRIDGMWPLEGAAANGRLDMIRYLWELKTRADMAGMPYGGFSHRQCLRAMNFARENEHLGCRDLVSELSGISVDRLETDEYGAPWIAY